MSSPLRGDERSNLWLGVGLDNVGLAQQLLCACGYKVRCGIMRYGESLGELVFFDDNEVSVTQGERVWHCPGCHDRLDLPGLR